MVTSQDIDPLPALAEPGECSARIGRLPADRLHQSQPPFL